MAEPPTTVSRRTFLESTGAIGTLPLAGCLDTGQADLSGDLSVEWVSETAVEYDGNHHALATATVDGHPVISIPRNDATGEHCGVVTLDESGDVLWSNTLPAEHCNAHAIGDIGVGDLDNNDRPAFVAATETHGVFAYDAVTGEGVFRQDLLESIGYSAPVVADVTGDGAAELAVVDFEGLLTVARGDGSIVWTKELDGIVYVTPIVADFTGDGTPNMVVNHGRRPATVACFDGSGESVWTTELDRVSLSWTLIERDEKPALVAATDEDLVYLEGSTGDLRWTTSVGERVTAGDSDQTAVYAAARDGIVRSLALEGGGVRWRKQITEDGVRIPAPAVGAVSSAETPDVVTTADDGTVAILDSESGEVLARHRAEAGLYTSPVLADISGNGRDEILLLYGDGRVAALSYEEY